MNVNEVFGIISQDKEFYDKSGGGVTISGGEPLLQADFCADLAEKCTENNISVIIDTAGNVPFDVFEKLIPYVKCFYFDLKCGTEKYQKLGADGKRIYDNLSKLSDSADVSVRIPVIPEFNDNAETMEMFAEFLGGKNIREVYLLPFHRLGAGKYKALGLDYSFGGVSPESEQSVKPFADIFADKNIKCKIGE
jgi:pyruvate formate lyase activating enzyme